MLSNVGCVFIYIIDFSFWVNMDREKLGFVGTKALRNYMR